MTYAQVVTPGWRIVFMDDEGQEYNVHTTEELERFVICESSTQTEVPPADQDNPAVKAAIKTLVEQEGVALESVTVVSSLQSSGPTRAWDAKNRDKSA